MQLSVYVLGREVATPDEAREILGLSRAGGAAGRAAE